MSAAEATGEVVQAVLAQLGPGPRVRHITPGDYQIDRDHVRALVESGGDWPPILVTGVEGRILDGNHRANAAREMGWTTIPAVVVDVDHRSAEGFVVAFQANAKHGRPYSLAERTAGARSLLKLSPEWSDRRIAEVCVLSPTTVGKLRPPATVQDGQLRGRVGGDGKVRPTPAVAAERRERAAREVEAKPTASDREVALRTGLSPRTVADVRRRNAAGDDAVPPRLRAVPPATKPEVEEPPKVAVRDVIVLVPTDWAAEEPCRRSNAARQFARFMDRFTRWHNKSFEQWMGEVGADCPAELRTEAVELAGWMADAWKQYAARLASPTAPREVG